MEEMGPLAAGLVTGAVDKEVLTVAAETEAASAVWAVANAEVGASMAMVAGMMAAGGVMVAGPDMPCIVCDLPGRRTPGPRRAPGCKIASPSRTFRRRRSSRCASSA